MPYPTPIGTVELTGTPTLPELVLRVNSFAQIPGQAVTYQQWAKGLPGRYWDGDRQAWVITGLGNVPDPDTLLAQVALTLVPPTNGALAGWALRDLMVPVAQFTDHDPTIMRVRHRLTGWETCRERLGDGAIWQKADQWFEVPITDATRAGVLRGGIHWPQGTFERSIAAKQPPALGPAIRGFAGQLASAPNADRFGGLPELSEWTGLIPDWFGHGNPDDAVYQLYEYQQLGAIAAACHQQIIADSPGVGKTITALAAAAIRSSRRTLILCPPLVVSNWVRETRISGLADLGGTTDGEVVAFVPGRKSPELPEHGVVVVADSTVAARPELQDALCGWGADVFVYDEAHRAMTMGSKRSRAAIRLAKSARYAIPVTGTPMLSGPHQLVPLLEMTGQLGWLFDGRGPFLERFCRRDRFGNFSARKRSLPELGRVCAEQVWVRRSKADVLPQLPPKYRSELQVQVKLSEYRTAHQAVIAQVDAWIAEIRAEAGRDPNQAEQDEFVDGSLSLISQLRQAAGVCKVPAAAEFVQLHDFAETDGRFDRPLLVWTHHQQVTDAMTTAVAKLGLPHGVIRGGTPPAERDRLVAAFQAGEIAVLVLSITAAGVGITLTRAQDAVFVETDWTPALVLQAEDRCHRVGQTAQNVSYTTLVAPGTLDEHIQQALQRKGMVLGAVFHEDLDVSVASGSQLQTAAELLAGMVQTRLQRRTR